MQKYETASYYDEADLLSPRAHSDYADASCSIL
jgi:hypothetical protein